MGVYEGYISLRVKKTVLFVGLVRVFIVMQKRRKKGKQIFYFSIYKFFLLCYNKKEYDHTARRFRVKRIKGVQP